MPTLLVWNGHRFFFYSAERGEPAHIHVLKAGMEAKIWLHDLAVAANFGYSPRELGAILDVVREHRVAFRKAWDDHFAD